MPAWDAFKRNVEPRINPARVTSSENAFLAAGPPRIEDSQANADPSAAVVYPIGGVQGFSMSQNQGWTRAFEIGSHYGYMLPGRWSGAGSMSRLYIDGYSLLRVMYAYKDLSGQGGAGLNPILEGLHPANWPTDVRMAPGVDDDVFLNLGSDYFRTPTGIMVVLSDIQSVPKTGIYLEECVVGSHQFGMGADGGILAESANFVPNALVPVRFEPSASQKAAGVVGGAATYVNNGVTRFGGS